MKIFISALAIVLLLTNCVCAKTTVVSWYGSHWTGKKTANGERFNPRKLTAASKTLPMGTRVMLQNGTHRVVVRINDRGPYVRGRSLDISERAARILKIHDRGVCRVKYRILAGK
jgi:rare lipoprotein A